ncbi:MAG: MCE family protein [PVC group bacterium]|nr:MCE family protein [PVC group bacterium]
MSTEFKVGIFVLLAIIVLSFIVFKIGGPDIFNTNRYQLDVVFDFVNGIGMDAPVHVAGVKVGKVETVEIFYSPQTQKTQVKLQFLVNNNVKIPIDSVAYINSLGILGEKYVEIVPGENRTDFLADGDTIIGNNPVQLEKLTESLVDIVGDQTVRDSLKQSFSNVRQATDNLLAVSITLNEVADEVKNGQGTIGRFINDDSIYMETEKMVINLNEKLEKTITDLNLQLNALIQDLKSHPWKLLHKPKTPKKKKSSKEKKKIKTTNNSGVLYQN